MMDDVKNGLGRRGADGAAAMPSKHHPSSIIHSQHSQHSDLPHRGHLSTERRLDAAAELDTLSVAQTLTLINEQDALVPSAVRAAIPVMTRLVEAVAAALRDGGRLIYLGAGISGRLGVLDASECPPTYYTDPSQVVGIIAGGDGALRKSAEGAEDDVRGALPELERLNVGRGDVVVGIAAGGTTPYVWGALAYAKLRGCVTGLVCCVPFEDAARDRSDAERQSVDHAIALLVGPEVVTGSTRMKAGTATKLALNMITTGAMVQIGKTWGNLMVDLRATNAKLLDRAARIIEGQTGVERERALALLDQAGGRVKIALVMAKRNVDAAEAERLIAQAGGQLRPILGAPR